MVCSKQKLVMYSVTIICGVITASLCSYWCYKFTLNEDLSVINYKEFHHETNDDVFPTVSLCLGNPFLKKRLYEYGVNKSTYVSFSRGKFFTNEMLDIDFSRVTVDIVDYIKGYRMYFNNSTYVKFEARLSILEKEMLTFNSFNGFIGHSGTFFKCFALKIPAIKNLQAFRILLTNNIFPYGIRPTKNFLKTSVHLPKQILLSQHTEKGI